MTRIFIEKPKKPVCFETANIVAMVLSLIILFFLQIFLFLIFLVAMIVFCIVSMQEFKHYPIAKLYIKDGSLYYYKKSLIEIELANIQSVVVSFDNKHKPYIDVTYLDDLDRETKLVINEERAQEIVDGINEEIVKSKETTKSKKNKKIR